VNNLFILSLVMGLLCTVCYSVQGIGGDPLPSHWMHPTRRLLGPFQLDPPVHGNTCEVQQGGTTKVENQKLMDLWVYPLVGTL
jgi:hypothetical protein